MAKGFVSRAGVWVIAVFGISILGALISGAVPTWASIFPWIALVIGIGLAIYTVAIKESIKFMVAYIVLVVTAAPFAILGQVSTFLGGFITGFFTNLLVILAPGAVFVAARAVYRVLKQN